MNADLETVLREGLDQSTREVPNGPDLGRVINRGRRRRARRRLTMAGGAGAGVAAALIVGSALIGNTDGADNVVATDPSSDTSGETGVDFVSGTDRDEVTADVVAAHLPSLPPPTDVYPSDWDHAGPMPDRDHADATDWQATYVVSTHEDLLVISGYAPPGEQADPGCQAVDPAGQPGCARREVPGGTITDSSYTIDGDYVFYTAYVADGGFSVTALETVTASSWQQASDRRGFSPDDLWPLVTDPDLAFPLPASRS